MGALKVAFVSLLVVHVLARASSLPCSPKETSWVVEDSAGASALASATKCSGGIFDVEWRGHVEFPSTLFITDGSFLNITRADTGAIANGGGRVQFLNVIDATVHVSGLRIENCSATSGGGIFADGSVLSFSDVSFYSNTADQEGGALIVWSSYVSWSGNTRFFHNIAEAGGALRVSASYVSWSGETNFSSNTGNFEGGALDISGSDVSWSGETSFSNNTGGISGGGALLIVGSDVSWSGETSFSNNTGGTEGGGLLIFGSDVSWRGETSFSGNTAESGGAAFVSESNVSWSGETSFSGNHADGNGGAVYVSDKVVFFNEPISSWTGETSFSGNTATVSGGAMALVGKADVTLSVVIFEGNRAEISGGALYVSGLSVGPKFILTNFTGNNSTLGGAVFSITSGTYEEPFFSIPQHPYPTTYENCTFTSNGASATGGAVDSAAGLDRIEHALFVGNSAGSGGALRLVGSTAITDCTFIENVSSEDEGAAISNVGALTTNNTRFTGNNFWCEPGTFRNSTEATTVANATRYDEVCKGCRKCDTCQVEDDQFVPVCIAQMEHTQSEGGDTTVETLKLDRGYWRATNKSYNILACYNEEACRGGLTGSTSFCQPGYEGQYCSVCSEGYSKTLAFSCTECVNTGGGVAIMVVAAVVVMFVGVALYVHLMSGEVDGARRGSVRWLTKHLPLQSIKIVVVVWQIVTQFTSVANVTYPDVYQRFLDSVNIINFDVLRIPSVGCMVDADFHDRLVVSTTGPLLALALLAATYTIATHMSPGSEAAIQTIRQKHLSMVLLIFFLVYSSVSAMVFQTFACDELDDGGDYLRADYRIKCTSSKHQAFMIFSGIMIFVYPVGIPVFYAYLLYKNHQILQNKADRATSDSVQPISDLCVPYKPDRFYYELIECLRRTLLTGVVVFIYPNSAAQVSITLVMAFAFVVVSLSLAPFASTWDARVSLTGHVVVFFSMYLALLSKVDVSGERAYSKKVFAGILVATHAIMVAAIVVETVFMVRSEMHREGPECRESPRPRAFSKPSLFSLGQPCP